MCIYAAWAEQDWPAPLRSSTGFLSRSTALGTCNHVPGIERPFRRAGRLSGASRASFLCGCDEIVDTRVIHVIETCHLAQVASGTFGCFHAMPRILHDDALFRLQLELLERRFIHLRVRFWMLHILVADD